MQLYQCHDDGADCWFADIDDQGCAGRLAAYLFEETFMCGVAVPA